MLLTGTAAVDGVPVHLVCCCGWTYQECGELWEYSARERHLFGALLDLVDRSTPVDVAMSLVPSWTQSLGDLTRAAREVAA